MPVLRNLPAALRPVPRTARAAWDKTRDRAAELTTRLRRRTAQSDESSSGAPAETSAEAPATDTTDKSAPKPGPKAAAESAPEPVGRSTEKAAPKTPEKTTGSVAGKKTEEPQKDQEKDQKPQKAEKAEKAEKSEKPAARAVRKPPAKQAGTTRTPAKKNAVAGGPGGKDTGGDLNGMAKQDLYRRAQELDIPGRSKMSKEQLAEAIRRADRS
ncbi:hypothetical protein GCM10009678_01060 [Actinomadura kijaniata]|uniref:Type IV secretory pathway VirB10-like protein n=1 Tax=Actinomadura namibiensis TaxID=182080 RepID=A0A7W3QNB5_ACTNM|nr:Rho termination factor N-terminal domain-containing protein [Actinomadura namibiensis]MBA8953366.1 type IV secretory pathway VirB10-like protein [Actinomadura namibiensis]